jgi:mannose-6-phosphate isomerase-like protein (cupin superfamily)
MSDAARPSAETSTVTQEHLLSEPLTQFPGKQITVFVGNFPPGSATALHRHPGTELLFVLEGEGIMHIEGAESRELNSGNAVLVSPSPGMESFTHQAVNTDQGQTMRNLVVVIHDIGTPPALPVDPGQR